MFQAFLELPLGLPLSTVFILGLSAGISLLTTLVNRRFTDPEKSKAWRREISSGPSLSIEPH